MDKDSLVHECLCNRIPAVCWEADAVTLQVFDVVGCVEDVGFVSAEWLDNPAFVRSRLFAFEADQLDAAVRRALSDGQGECLHRVARGGGVRWKRTIFRPAPERGGAGDATLVALTLDATARVRIEAELRASLAAVKQREDLLSVASHELRGPIASLRLVEQAVAMLVRQGRAGDLAPQLTLLVEQLSGPVDQMHALVQSLFDVAQIQAGTFRVHREAVDVVAVTRKAIRLAQAADEAGASIRLRAPGRLVGRWDETRLMQVVVNLLSNALKYGGGKPVDVTIDRLHGERLVLTVRDHGIGIPLEQQDRIFERYGRADGAKDYPGLGLGLYIVRQIVRALGGTIGVESTPGDGALFRVELPLEAPEEERGLVDHAL